MNTTQDYRGQVLRSVNFEGKDIAGANFAGATLVDIKFDGCDLTGSDFSMAHVEKCSFKSANLSGSRMTGTKFSPATSFEGAQMENTILSGIDAQYANFDKADLTHTFLLAGDVRHSSFRNAILDQANLECADFSFGILPGASFVDARFVDASLRNSDLSNSNFGGVDLRKSFIGDCIWTSANLQQANLSGLYFGNSVIEGCFIDGAILDDCDMSSCVGSPSGEPFMPVPETPVAPIATYEPVTGLVPVARAATKTEAPTPPVVATPDSNASTTAFVEKNLGVTAVETYGDALINVIKSLIAEAKTFKLRTNLEGAVISPYVQGKLESDGSYSFEASSNKYVNPPLSESSNKALVDFGWSSPIPPELPNFYFKLSVGSTPSDISDIIAGTLLSVFNSGNDIQVDFTRAVKKYDDELETPLDEAVATLYSFR